MIVESIQPGLKIFIPLCSWKEYGDKAKYQNLGYHQIIKGCAFDQVVVIASYKSKCPKNDKKFKWVVHIPAFSANNKPYEIKVDGEWINEYGKYYEYGQEIYVLSLEEYMEVELSNDDDNGDLIITTQATGWGTLQANKKRTRGVPTYRGKNKRPIVEENDSDSDDESAIDDLADQIDDAAMSDVSENENGREIIIDPGVFQRQYNQFKLTGIEFESGAAGTTTEARYKEKTPLGILLHLYEPVMKLLISANKDKRRLLLSIEECYTYHAMMVYMSVVQLNSMPKYWDPMHPLMTSKFPFKEYMSLRRFSEIRANMRTYLATDNEGYPNNRAWKVRNAFDMVKRAFMGITKAPGEYLSMDESMLHYTGSRNPIRVIIPNKPNNGFRVFMLVDYSTKIVINMNLDDKVDNGDNCRDFPGGYTGRKVTELVVNDNGTHYFRGTGRTILTDNYYGSVDLAQELKSIGYNYISTLRRKRAPLVQSINEDGEDEGEDADFYPRGKHCRPSDNNPRGTLRTAIGPSPEFEVGLYSWMDNANVLFVDTKFGTEEPVRLRRRVGSTLTNYDVPQAIKVYNDNMGGVDQHDQMRDNSFRLDRHRTNKWTVRMLEYLFAMAVTNAYCIYRANHEPNSDKHLTHEEFMEALVSEFFNHEHCKRQRSNRPLTRREMNEVTINNTSHFKVQTAPRSRGPNAGNRRRRLRCRFPGCKKKTCFYCSQCSCFICEQHFEEFDHRYPPQPYRKRGPMGSPQSSDEEEEDGEEEG